MTGKPLPFSHRSRSNNREHRSPNEFSQKKSKAFFGNSNFKPPTKNGSQYPRPKFQTNSQYKNRQHSPHYIPDGNCSRRPLSRNTHLNVRNYTNSLLDQEQNNNTSHTENTDTTDVSEETLVEQQFNDLLLELKQDTQSEYFNCQEECNTHRRIHSLYFLQKQHMVTPTHNIYKTNI